MSEEQAPEVSRADIRRAAMNLLARREYARAELASRLSRRQLPADLVGEVLDDLVAENLLSDARFAESFVGARASRGKGPLRIRRELEERGVSGELIDIALEDSGVDWLDVAKAVRHKRFGAAIPVDFKDKARQMRFLQYRGFAPDQIQAATGGDD
ncbi:MAG: regulatory protein RecX [Gammaproteobacteria bacterium]